MVPSISAVSGMMLLVVPAVIADRDHRRIEHVDPAGHHRCSACTISHATGIGSTVRWGSLA
jgi:hypothetical protein